MKEEHGNTDNKNAAKEVKASSHLHIRVEPERKARYVKQAQAEGLKLAEWVKAHLDKASEGAF